MEEEARIKARFIGMLGVLLDARRKVRGKKGLMARRKLRTLNVLLTQLLNGLNISEAEECYRKFLETGERKIMVRRIKSKDRYRLCVIPHFLDDTDRILTRDVGMPTQSVITTVTSRRYKVRTGELKYAFFSYLLGREVDSKTITHLLRLKSIDRMIEMFHEKLEREVPVEVANLPQEEA